MTSDEKNTGKPYQPLSLEGDEDAPFGTPAGENAFEPSEPVADYDVAESGNAPSYRTLGGATTDSFASADENGSDAVVMDESTFEESGFDEAQSADSFDDFDDFDDDIADFSEADTGGVDEFDAPYGHQPKGKTPLGKYVVPLVVLALAGGAGGFVLLKTGIIGGTTEITHGPVSYDEAAADADSLADPGVFPGQDGGGAPVNAFAQPGAIVEDSEIPMPQPISNDGVVEGDALAVDGNAPIITLADSAPADNAAEGAVESAESTAEILFAPAEESAGSDAPELAQRADGTVIEQGDTPESAANSATPNAAASGSPATALPDTAAQGTVVEDTEGTASSAPVITATDLTPMPSGSGSQPVEMPAEDQPAMPSFPDVNDTQSYTATAGTSVGQPTSPDSSGTVSLPSVNGAAGAPVAADPVVSGTAASPTTPTEYSGPDVYYDSAATIMTGPAEQGAGPRRVDPVVEPGSKFVVVKKGASAESSEALLVSAGRALKLGRYDAAIEMYDRLYAQNQRDTRILMGRAVAYQKAGRAEAALQAYEQLLAIDSKNADALVNMLGLLRTQYPEVALRRLIELRDQHPNNAGIVAQIGVTQADLGQYDDAMRSLQIASTLEPRNAQHVFNMAVIADRHGKREDAVTLYQQALETDSVYGGARSLPRDQIYDRLAALRQRG